MYVYIYVYTYAYELVLAPCSRRAIGCINVCVILSFLVPRRRGRRKREREREMRERRGKYRGRGRRGAGTELTRNGEFPSHKNKISPL
jgi:hypothetical protein